MITISLPFCLGRWRRNEHSKSARIHRAWSQGTRRAVPLQVSPPDSCRSVTGANEWSDSVIFVHGLKGHPKHTWGRETTGGDTAHQRTDVGLNKKRASIRSLLKSGKTTSTSPSEAGNQPKPFWPEEFLSRDLPDARIWTYGYNADVIQGMFQAGNRNSISQHGRDLSAQFERDINNRVRHSGNHCFRA